MTCKKCLNNVVSEPLTYSKSEFQENLNYDSAFKQATDYFNIIKKDYSIQNISQDYNTQDYSESHGVNGAYGLN